MTVNASLIDRKLGREGTVLLQRFLFLALYDIIV
eukprot:IDg5092t1